MIYKYIGTNIYELKTEDIYDDIMTVTLFVQENAHSSISPLFILISKSSSNGCRHIGHLLDWSLNVFAHPLHMHWITGKLLINYVAKMLKVKNRTIRALDRLSKCKVQLVQCQSTHYSVLMKSAWLSLAVLTIWRHGSTIVSLGSIMHITHSLPAPLFSWFGLEFPVPYISCSS